MSFDDTLYQKTTLYFRARIEYELLYLQGRASHIRWGAVVQLGERAFTGAGEAPKRVQLIVDRLAKCAAEDVMGMKPTIETADDLERAMWEYARNWAGAIQERNAKAVQTRTIIETADGATVREIVKREVASFHRTMHRGVWSQDKTYEKGQMATFNGATWSCQLDRTRGKPGESADWVLIVKAGRDGRRG